MITHKLAKELKEAGFPQKNGKSENGFKVFPPYTPILEELIDEIEFKWLGKELSTLVFSRSSTGYCVVNWRKEKEQTYTTTGKSWLEAVTKLYIKVNK